MDEVKDFHPAVEEWLSGHGYSFDHHVAMPHAGIADFVARKDGKTLIVEAKTKGNDIRWAISQVKGYQWQLPDSKCAVAVPQDQFRDEYARLCTSANIQLICIDFIPVPPSPKNKAGDKSDQGELVLDAFKGAMQEYFTRPHIELEEKLYSLLNRAMKIAEDQQATIEELQWRLSEAENKETLDIVEDAGLLPELYAIAREVLR